MLRGNESVGTVVYIVLSSSISVVLPLLLMYILVGNQGQFSYRDPHQVGRNAKLQKVE